MSSDPRALSASDVQILKRFLEMNNKDVGREAHEDAEETLLNTEDLYVAVPPCGQGIPARQGTVPGQSRCCLFKLVMRDGTSSGTSGMQYELVPLIHPKTGLHVQRMVYNIYPQVIPPYLPPNEKYIQIKRDKYGNWLVIPPTHFATTTSTSTTLPGILIQECVTSCKWTWNGSYWTTDGCTSTSTTTTSSTTTSSTTTAPCLCPGTTSTTTSTTTTPCINCSYPPFCGTAVGQCYIAECNQYPTNTRSSCTNSTTTTPFCDCATTSTAGPCNSPPCGGQHANCGNNCTWNWNGTEWVLVYQNCVDCAYPPADADTCSAYIQPCGNELTYFFFGGGPGAGGFGGGGAGIPVCCWCWDSKLGEWVLPSNDPSSVNYGNCGTGGNYFEGGWTDTWCVCDFMVGALQCNDTCHYVGGGFTCSPPPPYTGTTPNPSDPSSGSGCGGTPTGCVFHLTRALWNCTILNGDGVGPPCSCVEGNPPPCLLKFSSLTTTTAGPGTSTTVNPACNCGFCYTSTTKKPISGQCVWQCSGAGGSWSLVSNGCDCSTPCTCSAPPDTCEESCQVQMSACTATTTTT